jgi:hypothetical protein
MIPQMALRDYSAYLDESAHSYTFALILNALDDNMRVDQAVRCVTPA